MREVHDALREDAEHVADAPEPAAADATAGTETGQAMASRFLPDCVKLFAGVAFGATSKAKLHSRVIAAMTLVKIAGGMADEVPGAAMPGDE